MDFLTVALVVAQAVTTPPTVVPPADGPVITRRFPVATGPVLPAPSTPRDTVFEYSAAYYKRLDIHRIGSYTMIPLFVFQTIAGSRLYDEGIFAPRWARTGHPIAAAGVGVLFAVNTVTGLMNLYEGRKDPEERRRKIFHATMMLAADAGFAATGILGARAANGGDGRELHRTVALTSVGVAVLGYVTMLDIFRKD
jgi:hypothetical protein